MALPPGLTPKSVTIGVASFTDGSLADGTVTITAPVNILHTPTNRPIFSSQMSKRFVDGEATFDLLPTDAPGLNRVDWVYKANIVVSGALVQPEPVYFLLPTAGPDTIDLDGLVTVPSSAGIPISATVVTSVNGQTGDVTVSGSGGTTVDATTTVKGIVELATNTETTTGTDTVRAVTPAGVKAVADTKAAASHTHGVTDLTATGTKSATTFLRGDNTWAVPAGSGGGAGVDATDVGFDVVLIMGQSNALGINEDGNLRLAPLDPRVYAWEAGGTYAGKLTQSPATGIVHAGGASGLGPGHPFALEYVASVPPNRRVLLAPAAYSGTSFSGGGGETGNVWDSDGTNNLYTGAIALARAALGSHLNNRLAAVIWHQGESAVGMTQSQYAAKLDALIAKTRTDLSAPNVPFLVAGLVPEWVGVDASRLAIQAALAATPSRVARTAYVDGPRSARNADGIHYNATGQVLLGRGYAQALPYATGNTAPGTSPTLPVPATVTGLTPAVTNTDVALAWLPVPGAYNYRVEHRTGAGAWTENAVTFGTAYTVSGLAATTLYDLRVTALGPGGAATPAVVSATTGTAAAGAVTAFSDDFTGTTGTLLTTRGWTTPIDGVKIESNAAQIDRNDPGTGVAVRDLGSANGTVAGTTSGPAQWTTGLVIRYVDANNYFLVSDGKLQVKVAGTLTQLATVADNLGALSVVLNGSAITVTCDGVQQAQVTSTTHQSATWHGIFLGHPDGRVDNFAYTPPA